MGTAIQSRGLIRLRFDAFGKTIGGGVFFHREAHCALSSLFFVMLAIAAVRFIHLVLQNDDILILLFYLHSLD